MMRLLILTVVPILGVLCPEARPDPLELVPDSGETLPPLKEGPAPRDFQGMWAGFDPRAEPLEVDVLKEWEEEGVLLRVLRFRIGIFKGKKARLAAIYGFPKEPSLSGTKLPGLLQIHGGGQYADHRACLLNARRGYATLSIAWAGRISAPEYRVTPRDVKIFWDGKTDDPRYKVTTDWGAVDGYHAPGRNPGNVFPSAKAAAWTLDAIESPRNSGWFLCALAARRALTFLERQPEVDPDRLGVYGHSMGGKLTVMASVDPRVKAAAPSCGGISDRDNSSALYRATIGDPVSLREVSCPIVFLSPANDFHGLVGDLPKAVEELKSEVWRITSSPQHNHQDTPPYEVATLLWFDEHLKGSFSFPKTPESSLLLKTPDGIPVLSVRPDASRPILSVDVYYTQQGKLEETRRDREDIMNRFWHHAPAVEANGVWSARLPLTGDDRPLKVYANVAYPLDVPVTGAGYYYAPYTARSFNLSSLLKSVAASELLAASVRATLEPSLRIEDFEGDWEKEWFTYRPLEWARSTHKVGDVAWKAPASAVLALDVRAAAENKLVVRLDGFAAEVGVGGGDRWRTLRLRPEDFRDGGDKPLSGWASIRRLKLSPFERVNPKQFGGTWKGDPPEFRNMRWEPVDR